MERLDPDHIAVQQVLGGFTILDSRGGVAHTHDPVRLSTADPTGCLEMYVGLRPYPGPRASEVLLFGTGPTAFRLAIPGSTLVPITLDTSRGAGCEIHHALVNRMIVVLGARQIRLRPVAW